MALSIVKIRTTTDWAMLGTAAVVVLIAVWFSAKWNFANALSSRAELKEIVDLAVSLAPSDPQTRFAAASIYRKSFDPEDQERSMAEYERAAALSPDNFIGWLELGRARERNGDQVGAELALRRALDLAPNYANVQWALGNTLLRSGRSDEGFAYVGSAARSNPVYVPPAVVTTMEMLDGDIAATKERIGDTPAINSALADYLVRQKRYDDAVAAWEAVPPESRNTEFKDNGTRIASLLFASNQYRFAVRVFGDLGENGAERVSAGKIFDGGFEAGVKLKGAGSFEWQIPDGPEPQIAISRTQKHSGESSLLIVFNTMQTSNFREVSQRVAVEPGAVYELEFYYRSELKTGFTVHWEVMNAMDSVTLATSAPVAANSDWAAVKAKFTVPSSTDGVVIKMVRDRCPSTVCPISGSLWFDDISIKKL